MIRSLIVDDEPFVRSGLRSLLEAHADTLEIVGECENISDAIVVTRSTKPNLIFLDINMPDGTGFDFLDRIELEGVNVIFITAYHEYALQALKVGAIDYLLKPISSFELKSAIQKIDLKKELLLKERLEISKKKLVGTIDKIVLHFHDKYQVVRLNELTYCKSEGSYTKFFLTDGREFITSKNIKEYDIGLPANFVRCHQSYLVNIDFADSYDKEGVIVLTTGTNIPVSVRKKDAVITKLIDVR